VPFSRDREAYLGFGGKAQSTPRKPGKKADVLTGDALTRLLREGIIL
jgi:hypothetical protein